MSYLVDTSVISELVKPRPQASVLAWLSACEEDQLFLSVLTIGELEKGVARLPESRRKAMLRRWIRRDLVMRFGDRLLGIDQRVAQRWGVLVGPSEQRGRPLPVIDSLIAATGLVHQLTVVSRNTTDFERCGIECISPWEG